MALTGHCRDLTRSLQPVGDCDSASAPKKQYLLRAPQAGCWVSWDWPDGLGGAGGEGAAPSFAAPLAVFQSGQILHPSPKCVVSTGSSQEGLGCLAEPQGHSQTSPPPYNDRPDRHQPCGHPTTHHTSSSCSCFALQFSLDLQLGVTKIRLNLSSA